jgi:hypothetical protein
MSKLIKSDHLTLGHKLTIWKVDKFRMVTEIWSDQETSCQNAGVLDVKVPGLVGRQFCMALKCCSGK